MIDVTRRPEDQLLIESVMASIGQSDIVTTKRLLASDLDWMYLLRTATRHQVLPLLQRLLADCERVGATVEAAARAHLQRELDTRVARNRLLAAETTRLARLAENARLPVLPFKGAVLATEVYGDVSLRQFADVDLLVDAAHSGAAEEFLRSLGYACREDHGWEAHFVHRESGLCVDLHRGRLTPENFPLGELFTPFWSGRAAVRIEGVSIETLSIEHLLIVLCIQAARDAWQGKTRLGKLCDIAHVVKAGARLNWPRVQSEARALHVARVLEFGLHLASRMTHVPLPAALAAQPPAGIATLIAQEERHLFVDPAARPPAVMQGHLFHFHLRERWRDRLRPYLPRALSLLRPTRRDRDDVRLPSWLSWAYYVLRPVLLVRRYGRFLRQGRLD